MIVVMVDKKHCVVNNAWLDKNLIKYISQKKKKSAAF